MTLNQSYYDQKQFIAEVDKKDSVVRKIERWEAHEKGILHRGFTCILVYHDQFLLQHRRHPAFDGYFDLTFSSHQIYANDTLQTDQEAIMKTLRREWNINKKDLKTDLKYLGKFYYRSKDPGSIYTEHEIDYIYQTELNNLPVPNYEYAYGFPLVDKKFIKNKKSPTIDCLAPWVLKFEEFIWE